MDARSATPWQPRALLLQPQPLPIPCHHAIIGILIEGVRDARSDGDSVRPAARVQERTSGSEDVPDAVRQLRRACMARQRRAGASPTPLRRRVPAWTPFPRAARACLAA